MIKDYIVGIGLDVLKDKLQDDISQNELKNKIDDFIERQSKYNFSCSVEEEIDFECLCIATKTTSQKAPKQIYSLLMFRLMQTNLL